jgi:tetratricopeptide (TPR) repeat protein
MNLKSSAAVLMVLLWTSSTASAADPKNAPPNGLLFPESVERAMMGQAMAAERNAPRFGTLTITSSSFGFVPKGPIELLIEKSNPPKTNPDKPAVKEADPARPAKNLGSDNVPELKKALQFLRQSDLEGAMKELHVAAQAHPELPSEYVMLYRIFAQANQSNAARTCLEKAVVKMPSDPEPWIMLGEVALQEQRLSEAELDFEKAKQLLTGYSNEKGKQLIEQQMLNGLAHIAEGRGNPAEAKSQLEEYLKKSPDDLDALQRLADMAFCAAKGKGTTADGVTAAYDVLKRAKEIDKRNSAKIHGSEQLPPAYDLLMKLIEKHDHGFSSKDAPKVEQLFRGALNIDGDNLDLRTTAWRWAIENGNTAFAQEQAEAALTIEAADNARPANERKWPNSSAGRMIAGVTAIWKKQWGDAENHFQVVYKLSPHDFAVRNNLALALVEQNNQTKKDKALELAYANYQDNKDNNNTVESAATLSWVYFRLGKFDLASAAMDTVVRTTNGNVSDPNTATYFAYILDKRDNGRNGMKYQAKRILDNLLMKSGRPFCMQPEARQLYQKLKDVKEP